MHTKGVGAELREKQPPACMVVWYNKRHTNKYEKHFPKMYRDVGMAVPKTTQTRYMDGSVQATQRTTQVTQPPAKCIPVYGLGVCVFVWRVSGNKNYPNCIQYQQYPSRYTSTITEAVAIIVIVLQGRDRLSTFLCYNAKVHYLLHKLRMSCK